MAARPPKAFDVWFVAANTVYKQVPYGVVADWTQQGRLGAADMLRPAGAADPWKKVGEWELLADYLPRPDKAVAVTTATGAAVGVAAAGGTTTAVAEAPTTSLELPEPADPDPGFRAGGGEAEDDEVDMIPLIDISMVLLVFFIIVSATGALSPVDVPDMKYAGILSDVSDAVVMTIERGGPDEVYYTVREGTSPAKPEYSRLQNPEEAIKALDAVLADRTRPPEVRVSCAKDLPNERVMELTLELRKRQEKGKVNAFVATVNEAPKGESP
ncbi:MAG: biopolymer transporter ExbD [Gemmataceae bacterium]|nr:biopolymer transporter ExbD [Gemmataceae bacterium]